MGYAAAMTTSLPFVRDARATVTLAAPVPDGAAAMSGTVGVRVGADDMTIAVTVPADPVALDALLPVFHGLTDAIVDRVADRAAATGQRVSCHQGCGACCRQAASISPSEARGLARLVAAMPPERRAVIEARFAAARAATAPILATALDDTAAAGTEKFGLAYLALGIACPFLEDESCSIYADRPMICREHLVSSPPVECRTPGSGRVTGIMGTARMTKAFRAVDTALEQRGILLLNEALEWAATHPEGVPHPGPALVQTVFAQLAASD